MRRAFPQIPLCECGHDRSYHSSQGCEHGSGPEKLNWMTGEPMPQEPCSCTTFREVPE